MGLLSIFKKVSGIKTSQKSLHEAIRIARVAIFKKLQKEYDLNSEEDQKISAHVADSLFYLNPKDWFLLEKDSTILENDTFGFSKGKFNQVRTSILEDYETRNMVTEILKVYMAYLMYEDVQIPTESSYLFKNIDPKEWQVALINRFILKYEKEFPGEPNIERAQSLTHNYWTKYGTG